jgi:hypothetical protein
MTAVSTSIETYHALRDDGTLSRQQKVIVDLMRPSRDYSLQELCQLTGLPVNVVSARCHALRGLGVLELGPTRACSVTKRSIHPVRLPRAGEPQGALFS